MIDYDLYPEYDINENGEVRRTTDSQETEFIGWAPERDEDDEIEEEA